MVLGFKRALAVIAVSSAFIWLGSSPALAAEGPYRQPVPFPDIVAQFCGAGLGDVVVHAVIDKAYLMSFRQQDGTIRVETNGHVVVTITGNGKTLTFNISGPESFILSPDASQVLSAKFGGLTLMLQPLGLHYGLLEIDATGQVTKSTGHTTDICALLS